MAESAESLYRRGAISPKQASKHTLPVLKKTKVERDNEEDFDGKQGLADQGGRKLKGHQLFRTGHIQKPALQGTEKRKNTGFKFDNKLGNSKGSPGANEIDESEHQKPDVPPSAGLGRRVSKGGDDTNAMDDKSGMDKWGKRPIPNAPKKKLKPSQGGSNKFADKKPAKQGGQYGGGGRDTQ